MREELTVQDFVPLIVITAFGVLFAVIMVQLIKREGRRRSGQH